MPGYSYMVLGAGKQGVAAAYDLILFGQAAHVTLADGSSKFAKASVHRLRKLLGPKLRKNHATLEARSLNVKDQKSVEKALASYDAVLSAVPFYLNPGIAQAAIAARTHYADLGGYFETTQKIMTLHQQARRAGIAMITDCGVAPGLCNSLAACGIEQLVKTSEVHMYCGGLPQKPRPPLNYKIVFNLQGLLGNYFGKAYVLEKGRIRQVPSFSGREELVFDKPLGKLEALITGGATGTCPWTYKGKIKTYDYKTLRYPGHYDKIQTLKDLGLLETNLVRVNGYRIAPRDVFVATAGPKLWFPDDRDLLVMRVIVRGRTKHARVEIVYDLLDYYDPKTGFTAMQRTTGFSAAIMLALLAQGRIRQRGFVPVEKAVSGHEFLEEIRRRGILVKQKTRVLK